MQFESGILTLLSGTLLLGLLLVSPALYADCDFKVASFNIHYIVTTDGPDEDWEARKHAVAEVLQRVDADIIAFQEMETFEGRSFSYQNQQLDWIRAKVPGYAVAAYGDAATFPITQPILYRQDRFTALEQGFFFYSDEPDRIYSPQWDGGYPYFSTWVRFRSACKGENLFVMNVHNDYSSRSNRLRSSELIAQRIGAHAADDAVIVLGDFNVRSSAREIRLIEETGLRVVEPVGSTNRIWGMHLVSAIDHFIIGPGLEPGGEIRVWKDKIDGEYPSDHYPISLQLAW